MSLPVRECKHMGKLRLRLYGVFILVEADNPSLTAGTQVEIGDSG